MAWTVTSQILLYIKGLFWWCPILPTLILDISTCVCPSLGYLDQMKVILKEKSSSKFKMNSSIILLIANVFRIFYWFQKSFPTYLLFQSIYLLVLLELKKKLPFLK